METIGIIAEYNPFHNGHLYMLLEAKRITGAENVVVVMSGNFVQRGAPAWTDKYTRTKLALAAGVDMIFELPVCYAASSAEIFATAGVSLLHSLGFVKGICFGSECGKLDELNRVAEYLAAPPPSFDRQIKSLTATGLSYPAARMMALPKKWQKAVSSPNNILSIEYLKAIKRLESPLIPITVQRTKTGHHDTALSGNIASATAIRAASSHITNGYLPEDILAAIPDSSARLLNENRERFPVTADDFSLLMYYQLSHLLHRDKNNDILDMTPDLYHRIQNMLYEYNTLSSFIDKLKTKQLTYSRISRVLFHCLLDIKKEDIRMIKPSFSSPLEEKSEALKQNMENLQQEEQSLLVVPYARLLGFRKKKSHLLRKTKNIPVITKPADGFTLLDKFYNQTNHSGHLANYGKYLLKKDFAAANIYQQVQRNKLGGIFLPEERRGPVIMP